MLGGFDISNGCNSCADVGGEEFMNLNGNGVNNSIPMNGGNNNGLPMNGGNNNGLPMNAGNNNGIPMNAGNNNSIPMNGGNNNSIPMNAGNNAIKEVNINNNNRNSGLNISGNNVLNTVQNAVKRYQNNNNSNNSNKKKDDLKKMDDEMLLKMGLVIMIALAFHQTIKHYIQQSIKFDEKNSYYYLVYSVIISLIGIACMRVL